MGGVARTLKTKKRPHLNRVKADELNKLEDNCLGYTETTLVTSGVLTKFVLLGANYQTRLMVNDVKKLD